MAYNVLEEDWTGPHGGLESSAVAATGSTIKLNNCEEANYERAYLTYLLDLRRPPSHRG